MKKVLALVFIGSMLTFAACQNKPKTEEATADSTATMLTDTTTMTADSAAPTTSDSTAMMPDDSAK